MPNNTSVWSLYRTAEDRFDADIDCIDEPAVSPRRRPAQIPSLNLSSLASRKDPLTELDAGNIICGPTENADSVMVAEYAKKYHMIRKQNQSLMETVRKQSKEIDRLKEVVRTLQSSDADSSESRNDRTISTNSSNLPMVRVTPQKRAHHHSRQKTPTASPRLARRPVARRLEMSNGSGDGLGGSRQSAVNLTPIAQSTPIRREAVQGSRVIHSEPRPRRAMADTLQDRDLATNSQSFSRSRQILRNAGIDSDVLMSTPTSNHTSSTDRTPRRNQSLLLGSPSVTVPPQIHPQSRSMPRVHSRSISTSDRSASASMANMSTPQNSLQAPLDISDNISDEAETPILHALHHRSNDTFVIDATPSKKKDTVQATSGDRTFLKHSAKPAPLIDYSWGSEQSPGYYLRRNRPNFIRRLEMRQEVIRNASEMRQDLEKQRKEAFRAVATGRRSLDDVNSIIFADPTAIQAFAVEDMRRVTRRRLSGTNEFRREVVDKERKLDQAVNRIRAACFSDRTKQIHLVRSRSQSVASDRRRRL